MSLQFVIDGYNIIKHAQFSRFSRKNIKDQRFALLELIKSHKLTGSQKNKVLVVFDGFPDASARSLREDSFEVIFSCDDSADKKIMQMVESSQNPKNIVVVSDDREIKFFVKSCGAAALGIEEFIIPKNNKAVSKKELDAIKTELSFSQVHEINEELKKLWIDKKSNTK
ncbi:MAG: NYN domain-containing protein [Candidatus Omnitrophica bacterium]|nr:NYN domain-containing protein [Candidatus Omnitrophota bacterium]